VKFSDHVARETEVTESKEQVEEGVKITTVTTTVTTVINGDENLTAEKTEKSEITVAENAKQATSESDNFQSEIIRSRGAGSVKRSMMMFMAEQEKAAASKTSAARNVKKMPAYVDYQTDQPSITGAGVVRVAVRFHRILSSLKMRRNRSKPAASSKSTMMLQIRNQH
jgi:hypothetical protein